MADLDQNPTDTGTSAEAITPTPLDAILETNAADVPAREPDGGDAIGGMEDPQVPLKALRKERERRQKADRQVEELRREMERFENAKFGFDEEQVEERLAAVDDAAKDPVASNYDKSHKSFVDRHKGDDVVAKVEDALRRVHREQGEHWQQVLRLVGSQVDPVAAVHAYFDQAGLLDFRGQPIDQVLASKDKQPQPDTSQFDRQIAELNRHGQEVAAAERRATVAASRIDFVSEFGKAAYDELDRRSMELMQSGHPVAAQFQQAVVSSPDPISTAAQILHQLGVWGQQTPQQAPQQQPQMTFPSNLANRRNVGQRAGPGYSGPRPLEDIFRH